MKNKSIIITYFTIFLLLATVLTGCNKKNKGTNIDTLGESETVVSNKIAVYENALTNYKIIWPTGPSDEEYTASTKLIKAFEDCGVAIKNDRDYIPQDGTNPESDYEILIGGTNREASMTIQAELKDDDWVVAVSGNKIILCGGTPKATLAATERFINDYLLVGEVSLLIPADLLIKNNGTYPVADFFINGNSITEYKLIKSFNANKLELYALTLFHDIIKERAGVTLSIINDRAEAVEHEIRIGATSRSGEDCKDYEYTFYADSGSIVINGGKHAIVKAVLAFVKSYLPKTSETAVYADIGETRTAVSTENTPLPYEASLDGRNLVALCDQKNASVVVVDIDAPDPTSASAVVWTWKPTSALGFTSTAGYANSIDEVILRYSEVLKSYVVCVTSSAGFIGVAKYPSGEAVWSSSATGLGPHSIDYLPNGNVAVACSGNSNTENGCIRIYTSSQGKSSWKYISVPLVSAHGVIWDDENELLWVLGSTELLAYRIGGTDSAPILTKADNMGGKIPTQGGHNLSVYAEDPDYLWISGTGVCLYRKSTGTFIEDFSGASTINAASVKSIDSFSDGTVVRTIANNVYKAHDTDRLVVFKQDDQGKFTRYEYTFKDRAFYKARRFAAQYS